MAARVVPRSADGTPGEDGRIVLISIGVSNTLAEFARFVDQRAAIETNEKLVLVNGAQVGRALGQWAFEGSETPWNRVNRNLRESVVTPEQVQAAWVMLPSSTRGPETLDRARAEMAQFTKVLQKAKERYPNLQLAYLSSRIYGGYIPDSDSEPNAYNHGFEVKWMIQEQIDGSPELNPDPSLGPVLAPWIAWGPYLWADGVVPRSDGLVWDCDDYASDGVHPGEGAQANVGALLLHHFTSDPTATSWFLPPTDEPSTASTGSSGTSETSEGPTGTTNTAAVTTSTMARLPRPRRLSSPRRPHRQTTRTSETRLGALAGIGIGLAIGSYAGYAVVGAPTEAVTIDSATPAGASR